MKILHLLAAAATLLLLSSAKSNAAEAPSRKVATAIKAEFSGRPISQKRVTLSAAERQELMGWLRDAKGKGLVPVAQTDARDLRGLDLLNRAIGRPPRSNLLNALGGVQAAAAKLDKCDEFLKQHQANGLFLDVGFFGNPNDDMLTATTLQAAFLNGQPRDVRNLGTHVAVFDSDDNDVTEASRISQVGQPTLLTAAPPRHGTVLEDKEPTSVATFTAFMLDGTPCSFRRVAGVTPPPKSIEVTAPNNSQNRKTVLCINRGAPDKEWPTPCDFGPFPQGTLNPPKVVVPLAGIIKMPYPLALNAGKIEGQLQVTAINSQNGTTCQGQDNDLGQQVLAQTTVTADKQGMSWSILADKALIFGATCFQQHSGLAFNMYWTVTVTRPDGRPATVTAIVSNTLEQGSANTLIVRPVDLQWGCLAAGTLVTLADGSRKAIEAITRDDLVLGPDRKPWQVFAHTKGEDAALIEVKAEDGTVARMTDEHPVITARDRRGRLRWTIASRLTVGMALITAKGASKVVSVEHRAYEGSVYNMAIKPLGADKGPARGSAFYADGLLVGDQTMQGLPVVDPSAVAADTSRAQAR
jgi:hypothetical protein